MAEPLISEDGDTKICKFRRSDSGRRNIKGKTETSVKLQQFLFQLLLQLKTDKGPVNKNLDKRVTTSFIFGSTSDWPIEPIIHRKLGEASLLHPTRWKPSLLDPTG